MMIPTNDLLRDFYGDIDWVHNQEGHRGRPYWPGGASGVTIDPGLDLGYADRSMIEQVVRQVAITARQWDAVMKVIGLRGDAARAAISPTLLTIRTTRAWAATIFPYIADPYWRSIKRKFPALAAAPGSVQTALLSLAYNRGSRNKALNVLSAPIEQGNWAAVALQISRMQQDHKLEGIRLRRRREGALIIDELNREAQTSATATAGSNAALPLASDPAVI